MIIEAIIIFMIGYVLGMMSICWWWKTIENNAGKKFVKDLDPK